MRRPLAQRSAEGGAGGLYGTVRVGVEKDAGEEAKRVIKSGPSAATGGQLRPKAFAF